MTTKNKHIQLTKNFNSKEFDSPDIEFSGRNISMELVNKLQKIRDITGFSIVIFSGVRSKLYNRKIKGVNNSEHVFSEAVDVLALTNKKMFFILKASFLVGFDRIGINNKCVHLGVSKTKPANVLWTYYKRKTKNTIL